MHKIILFIKSYRPDFERAKNLVQSIYKYNRDNIPLYISVNDVDYEFFKHNLPADVNLLKDSDIVECQTKNSWIYQQVVKSQVHKLKVCENYLCIDSDAEFIKDFFISDFMYNDQTPYTIMHESKDMLESMEIIKRKSVDAFYKEALRALRDYWGGSGKEWDYGPTPFIWSTKVWEHLENNFLIPNQLTFESFLFFLEDRSKKGPSEYTIYGEYLFKTRLIDIIPIQPLFKVYHFHEQYKMESCYNTIDKLRVNYLGIVKQSSWKQPALRPSFKTSLKLKIASVLLK
jgi:hypothetical protein